MVKPTTSDVENQATTADLLERKAETHVLLRWQQDLARRKNLNALEEEHYLENAARIGEHIRHFKMTLPKRDYTSLLCDFRLSEEAIAFYEGREE